MKQILIIFLILTALFESGHAQQKDFFFTTSDSVQLYVHISGKGKSCLFVHGGPGLTSYIFEVTPAAKTIEQRMHMIYFDQRGSGRSGSAKNDDYSIKRMEKDIDELREFLKIQRWDIMGHSFGGILMTAYAKDYPEHVRSLMYVHCTLNMNSSLQSHIDNGLRLLEEQKDTIKVDQQLPKFDQMIAVHKELAKKGIEYKIMFSSQAEQDMEDSLISASTPKLNQDFQRHVWKISEYFENYISYTSNIHCPVLVISGLRDYAVGPEQYKLWRFPDQRVVLYEGAHTSYQEKSTWFSEAIFNFINTLH